MLSQSIWLAAVIYLCGQHHTFLRLTYINDIVKVTFFSFECSFGHWCSQYFLSESFQQCRPAIMEAAIMQKSYCSLVSVVRVFIILTVSTISCARGWRFLAFVDGEAQWWIGDVRCYFNRAHASNCVDFLLNIHRLHLLWRVSGLWAFAIILLILRVHVFRYSSPLQQADTLGMLKVGSSCTSRSFWFGCVWSQLVKHSRSLWASNIVIVWAGIRQFPSYNVWRWCSGALCGHVAPRSSGSPGL